MRTCSVSPEFRSPISGCHIVSSMRSVVALIFNLSVAWVVIGGNSVALAQSGNLRSSFGMTLNRVAVSSVDFYAGSVSASSDLVASVGWQYTLEHRRDRALGVLTDVEAQLGLVERNAATASTTSNIVGFHATAGPQLNLKGLSVHAIGGLSFVKLTGGVVTTG